MPPQMEMLGEHVAEEALAAEDIKKRNAVTVVFGNPPYSNYSQANNGEYIRGLLDDYKRGLDERKLNLDDDYIKFWRRCEHFIEQSKRGIVCLITNHTFLDGVSFRKMREHAGRTFERILVLDLHGNTRKRRMAPDGQPDQNIFAIQQGVAVAAACRVTGTNRGNCTVMHSELWGARGQKLTALARGCKTFDWTRLKPESPYLFWVPKKVNEEYSEFTCVTDLFPVFGCGFATSRDAFVTDVSRTALEKRVRAYFADDQSSEEALCEKFGIRSYRAFSVAAHRTENRYDSSRVMKCFYRPFDDRWVYYAKNIVQEWQVRTMRHLGRDDALALVASRFTKGETPAHFFVTRRKVEKISLSNKTSNNAFAFPLYCYPDATDGLRLEESRSVNLSKPVLARFSERLGIPFQDFASSEPANSYSAHDIFHYVYAIFNSPSYRTRYDESLAFSFPRFPCPNDAKLFFELAAVGKKLVGVHLMESEEFSNLSIESGDPVGARITKVSYANGTAWIDPKRRHGFTGITTEVWEYTVGGYPVCEKWLTARQRRGGKRATEGLVLDENSVLEFRKIVHAIRRSRQLMEEIDACVDRWGGWPDAFTAIEPQT